ncbi:MAG: hypothetical protein M3Z08_21270 [Chloroflexota bacterium]|nr:hypothetical protein [Chloroflexota bacterium]MDQ2762529.1 hypothetical protein [Pseudomonadota bacterium]
MTGYMNNDGSELVGALNPSGIGQALQIDGSGNLKTTATLSAASQQNVNLNQVNGTTLGPANAVLTEANIQNFIRSGQGFSTTTGKLTSGGTITTGLSIFNPNASGKTLLVFSIRVAVGSSNFHTIGLTTTDPALGTAATIVNSKPGGASSIASTSYANTAVTPAGSTFDTFQVIASSMTEALTNGAILVVPPNNGAVLYVATATNNWIASMKWLEI